MLTVQGPQLSHSFANTRMYFWAALAGVAALSIASFYCAVHGAVNETLEFDLGETLSWSLPRWGIWPVLMPVCYWVYHIGRRRVSGIHSISITAVFAVLCNSAFAWIVNQIAGGRWTLLEASYYTAPPTIGALAILILIAVTVLRPNELKHVTRVGADAAARPIPLTVWKGLAKARIDARQVAWIRAARNYVELHADAASSIKRISLSELERRLADEGFLRVHRSYLVNRRRVSGLAGGKTRPTVVMSCGARVPVGRSYRSRVFAALECLPRAD